MSVRDLSFKSISEGILLCAFSAFIWTLKQQVFYGHLDLNYQHVTVKHKALLLHLYDTYRKGHWVSLVMISPLMCWADLSWNECPLCGVGGILFIELVFTGGRKVALIQRLLSVLQDEMYSCPRPLDSSPLSLFPIKHLKIHVCAFIFVCKKRGKDLLKRKEDEHPIELACKNVIWQSRLRGIQEV